MDDQRRAFLAGERPEDVLIYLNEGGVSNSESLTEHGERVDDGVVLVLAGDRGRRVFEQIAGVPAMTFAGAAMDADGEISAGCTSGVCPNTQSNPDGVHHIRVLLAFAEQQNEEAGGLYAEGDVIHAYAGCLCGTTYSDRWVTNSQHNQ